MQDAVQVIRVTYEGLEMFFKVGSGGYRALKDMAGMLKSCWIRKNWKAGQA